MNREECFKRCGEGENVCNCKSEKECGYLSQELNLEDEHIEDFDELECQTCGCVRGHARGCPDSLNPFDILINQGYD